jgi:cytochrome subunit of sulfide dehydrogenase
MVARWIAAALAALVPALALAQNKDQLYVASLAATCASCHGTNGRSAQGSPTQPLAGMPRNQMIEQLAAFKSGARTATVMHQLSKGYSDAQIAMLADYFAAQRR